MEKSIILLIIAAALALSGCSESGAAVTAGEQQTQIITTDVKPESELPVQAATDAKGNSSAKEEDDEIKPEDDGFGGEIIAGEDGTDEIVLTEESNYAAGTGNCIRNDATVTEIAPEPDIAIEDEQPSYDAEEEAVPPSIQIELVGGELASCMFLEPSCFTWGNISVDGDPEVVIAIIFDKTAKASFSFLYKDKPDKVTVYENGNKISTPDNKFTAKADCEYSITARWGENETIYYFYTEYKELSPITGADGSEIVEAPAYDPGEDFDEIVEEEIDE